jgi:hypothetical protein
VELERERREQLRLDQARGQARTLLAACEGAIAAVREPAVQQLAAEGLKGVRQELRRISGRIEAAPDEALRFARSTQKLLHKVIAEAQARAEQWSQQQAEAQARLAEAQTQIDAARQTGNKAGEKMLGEASEKLAQARSLQKQRRYAEATAACDEVQTLTGKAAEAAFDETVRREVTRGLLATLRNMGFVVAGPQLSQAEDNGDVVTLVGQLPSGRKARFDVHLDGRMDFDLDGYEGRSCGKELERIERVLNERFNVRLGPPQVTWKNPDKISKGSRDLPAGGRHAC